MPLRMFFKDKAVLSFIYFGNAIEYFICSLEFEVEVKLNFR